MALSSIAAERIQIRAHRMQHIHLHMGGVMIMLHGGGLRNVEWYIATKRLGHTCVRSLKYSVQAILGSPLTSTCLTSWHLPIRHRPALRPSLTLGLAMAGLTQATVIGIPRVWAPCVFRSYAHVSALGGHQPLCLPRSLHRSPRVRVRKHPDDRVAVAPDRLHLARPLAEDAQLSLQAHLEG